MALEVRVDPVPSAEPLRGRQVVREPEGDVDVGRFVGVAAELPRVRLPRRADPVVDPWQHGSFDNAGEIRRAAPVDRGCRVGVRERIEVIPRVVRLVVAVPATLPLRFGTSDTDGQRIAVKQNGVKSAH
ncbi:hypothetical protein [Halorubrum sp. ASP121]|uniref:hypothetical protein n=1 Tax=Halorubrum sp. ASP121 TaxID=1855858 RepID=UPI001305208E|nr:hypothetical protein [Halorubrum sp. ASP121]